MFLVLIPILNYISNLCLHLYLVNCLKAKVPKTVIFLVHIYYFVLLYTFQVSSSPLRCFVLQGDRVVQLSRRQSLTRWQVSPLCGDSSCAAHWEMLITLITRSPTPTPWVRHWRYSSGSGSKFHFHKDIQWIDMTLKIPCSSKRNPALHHAVKTTAKVLQCVLVEGWAHGS